MKLGSDAPWFKDRRLLAVAVSCLAAGFLIGLLIFGAPWGLRPDWGDLPTWLLFALGVVAGVTGLYQFSVFVENNAEETRRNIKRDALLDKQLADAEARALTDRRRQAEDVGLRVRSTPTNTAAYVLNESGRPIRDLTCKVMSRAGRRLVAEPGSSGVGMSVSAPYMFSAGPSEGQLSVARWDGGPRLEVLRPRSIRAFLFDPLARDADHIVVAWFTDDARNRWQLDEDMHLAQRDDEGEYRP